MMYQFQKDLPKIPLPELEETCERYLDTVAPLLSQAQIAKTTALVRDFQQGSGLKLQRQLDMIVRTNSSYLYKLLEESYLEKRLPLPINTNYAGVLSPILATSKTPLARIATWIYETLKFYFKVKHRQLKPDQDIFQKSSRTLCMIQYDNLFGTSRVPGIKKDSLQHASEPEHIVVIRRNVFYSLKVIEGGTLATVVEIEQQLNWILENTPLGEPALGALTTLNRTQWAVLRSHIAAVARDNAYSLALLDSALFVVCLDETIPTNLEEASRNALHGDGRNRWFDKPLQLIFTPSGQAAVNIEHTGLDGYTIMRFLSEVYQNCQHNSEPSALTTPVKFQPPTRARWSLTREILEEIEQAQFAVDDLIALHQTRVLEFKEFGLDFIKQHDFSPDAVIQLAIQLTYTRLHGSCCISESVHTRSFQYGRWEDVRVVTTESIEFIRAFTEPNPDETPYSALKLAVDAHVMRRLTCKKGLGIERHLEALHSLARYQGVIPDIFQDKAYMEVFCQPVVSTSGLLSEMGLVLFCFAPVVSHGYGVGYLSGSNGFIFNVTSQYRQTEKFIELLEQCLLELGKIIKINGEK